MTVLTLLAGLTRMRAAAVASLSWHGCPRRRVGKSSANPCSYRP